VRIGVVTATHLGPLSDRCEVDQTFSSAWSFDSSRTLMTRSTGPSYGPTFRVVTSNDAAGVLQIVGIVQSLLACTASGLTSDSRRCAPWWAIGWRSFAARVSERLLRRKSL